MKKEQKTRHIHVYLVSTNINANTVRWKTWNSYEKNKMGLWELYVDTLLFEHESADANSKYAFLIILQLINEYFRGCFDIGDTNAIR